jgi:hypothetical protein
LKNGSRAISVGTEDVNRERVELETAFPRFVIIHPEQIVHVRLSVEKGYSIISKSLKFILKSGYRSLLSVYNRLLVPQYCPWVASHLRLLRHHSTLNRGACIARSRPRVFRVTIRHTHCDQVLVERLNLDRQSASTSCADKSSRSQSYDPSESHASS